MAVEVRELVIKTTIDNSSAKKGPATRKSAENTNDIVQECVEQVMDLLKLQNER